MAVENTTGSATVTEELRTFYSLTLLKRLLARVPLFADAQRTIIPLNTGKTVQWRKWDSLGLATTALTEGDPPTAQTLATSEVTATLSEYGGYVKISKLAIDTFIDQIMDQATNVLAEQGGRSLHSLLVSTVQAGTQVQYASTATAQNQITAAMTLTVAELAEAVRTLEMNNVPRFPDGFYHALIGPQAKTDLAQSTDYRNQNMYVNTDSLRKGELVEVSGVKMMVSSDAPFLGLVGAGAPAAPVYASLVYGPDSFGVVDLAGSTIGRIDPQTQRGVEVHIVPATTPSKVDPLGQFGTAGWLARFAAKIIDQSRIVRIEHGVTA